MSAAEMALWARRHELTRAEMRSALWERRTLVKTSCMRGTLHLLAAGDWLLYIRALRASRLGAMRRIMARSGVSPKEADAVTEAVVEVLRSAPMTRSELTQAVLSRGILGKKAKPWFELSWWGVVRQAMVEGLICYGPERGAEATFVRADQWLPKQKEVGDREAQQLLVRRYLKAYGPATLRDFSRWAGMAVKEARPAWDSLQDEMVEVSVEGRKGWLLRQDYQQAANSAPRKAVLRLLPSFDPYLLGHVEKDHLVDDRYYKRVYRGAGWISPVVLLDGKVVGTWSLARGGKESLLKMELFAKPSRALRAAIEEEATSLGAFWETSCRVQYGR